MDEAARTRLAAWLTNAAGTPVQVTQMGLLSGGAIQQNWALDALVGGEERAWVLRTDHAAVLAVSRTRPQEYALLRAAHAAGVAVPEPLFLCEDAGVTGAPFFVMRRVAGIAQGHRLVRQAQGDALAHGLGEQLARIHRILPPCDDLAFLGTAPEDSCQAFVAEQRAALDAAGTPRPVLEWGLRHLERTAPPPVPPVLCHNDYRTGNYLVDGGTVAAVLDWEFAGWGDPHADLGWLCARCWRFGNDAQEAGGVGPRAAFYAGYAASGAALDPTRVPWWELAATLRWAVIAADQAGRHLSGAQPGLELALTGHIGPELELDVLRMTEVAGA